MNSRNAISAILPKMSNDETNNWALKREMFLELNFNEQAMRRNTNDFLFLLMSWSNTE
jgi:hypothetical protein